MGTLTAAEPSTGLRTFRRAAWFVLAYNIAVVLWGAYVRATGSGAGCGSHWPLCNGEVLPRAQTTQMAIEFTHRASSGLAAVFVVAMGLWSLRAFPRGHVARKWAGLSVIFIFVEALLGAGLVLFRLVEQDASVARAFSMPLHLINTLVLLACLAAMAWFAQPDPPRTAFRGRPGLLLATLPLVIAVSATGAVAALGDTLFPSTSLLGGLRQDVSGTAHFLLRLRLIHPALAVVTAVVVLFTALLMTRRGAPRARKAAGYVALLVIAQVAAGIVNVALLAPVWMQLVHLLIADTLWVALVLTTFEAIPANAHDH